MGCALLHGYAWCVTDFFEWIVGWIVAENNDGQHITNNK